MFFQIPIVRRRLERIPGAEPSRIEQLVRSAWPAGLRLGGAALQFVVTILIARFLGAEAAGIYFFWAAVVMEIGQVATYGLDRIALREVPRLQERPGAISRFLGPLRSSTLVLALIGGIGLSLYGFFFQQDWEWPAWWFVLPPLGAVGVCLSMINSEAMTGMGRPVLAIFYRHTLVVLVVLAVVLAAGKSLTPELALIAYTAGFALSGFGALFGPGFLRAGQPFRTPTRGALREQATVGAPVFASSVFTSLCLLIPLTVLERTHPSDEIAYVTTAFRIFVLIDVLAKAIHSLVMPELSLAAEKQDPEAMRRIFASAIWRGLALLGPALLGIFLFADEVMGVFGPAFVEGSVLLRILSGIGLVSLLMGPAHQLLLMVGRTRHMAAFSLVHLLFAGTLGILLIPSLGPVGFSFVIGGGILIEKALILWFALRSFAPSSRGGTTPANPS